MKERAVSISLLIIIALSPIVVSSGEQNYFYALKPGNIHEEAKGSGLNIQQVVFFALQRSWCRATVIRYTKEKHY